jgi:NOL1/NOP2/sun family putative RNA methylase
MKPLPPAFLARMENLLGAQYPAFLACYDQPHHVGLRVNTLKLTPQQFRAISPFALEQTPWAPAGFRLDGENEARPGKHPYHAAGLYYLQEPSAMSVAETLAPQPGEHVLDLAASPGGKSTHIAALMQNSGILIANEIRTKRIPQLASNLERWGARHTIIVNETPERLAERLPGWFDRVIVDAPCSGEGMFRKEPDVRAEWDASQLPAYAERQRLILQIASRNVRPGGVLVYATCTFAPEENEAVIASFLMENGDFSLDPAPILDQFAPAHPEKANAPLPGAARLLPHLHPGEGHFLARLRRSERAESIPEPREPRRTRLQRPALEYISKFFHEALTEITAPKPWILESPNLHLNTDHLVLRGARVFLLPEGAPDLDGLRVPVPGWEIGTLQKDRFEPAHALAMALPSAAFTRVANFAADAPQLQAYLRGEAIHNGDAANGWTVVAVEGYPLGWGKQVQGVLKNHLPAGLRWQ